MCVRCTHVYAHMHRVISCERMRMRARHEKNTQKQSANKIPPKIQKNRYSFKTFKKAFKKDFNE